LYQIEHGDEFALGDAHFLGAPNFYSARSTVLT